jgi:hypothetical protein
VCVVRTAHSELLELVSARKTANERGHLRTGNERSARRRDDLRQLTNRPTIGTMFL